MYYVQVLKHDYKPYK